MLGLINIGFLEIKLIDIIDVLLVTLFIYQLLRFMRGTVAVRIFFVFLVLYSSFWVVKVLKMELITSILDEFTGFGIITLVVLFQQEIRRFLLHLGRSSSYGNVLNFSRKDHLDNVNIKDLIAAVMSMSVMQTGALIVLSRTERMDELVQEENRLDAQLTKRLLLAIFNKNSPLHDGAVIVQYNRILAAGCILPISKNEKIGSLGVGTRHRAAMGITEDTDALCVVVSEETGKVSVCWRGRLTSKVSAEQLEGFITRYLTKKSVWNTEAPSMQPST